MFKLHIGKNTNHSLTEQDFKVILKAVGETLRILNEHSKLSAK